MLQQLAEVIKIPPPPRKKKIIIKRFVIDEKPYLWTFSHSIVMKTMVLWQILSTLILLYEKTLHPAFFYHYYFPPTSKISGSPGLSKKIFQAVSLQQNRLATSLRRTLS